MSLYKEATKLSSLYNIGFKAVTTGCVLTTGYLAVKDTEGPI